MSEADDLAEVRRLARPLASPADLDPLVERAGDARLVLLGEASHGTADHYRWRAEITRRLVAEHGFAFVAVEGDWPDCFAVNRWVKGRADQHLGAEALLARYDRWPTWMWANQEVAAFVAWLRDHNRGRPGDQVGFYGLDLYSLWDSLRAVLDYLAEHHPDALDAARAALRCFEPYGEDPQRYAWATRMVPDGCADEVIHLLGELRGGVGPVDGDPEADLDARQNGLVAEGAERYYRAMVRADDSSWNVRDCHMADTLDRLLDHHGPGAKGVVWEHNTHIGDARGTDMARAGLVNVGQLARDRHGDEGVVLVGFGAHRGTVVAADAWGAPMRTMTVPPARDGSHEDLLHRAVGQPALLVFPEDRSSPWLATTRQHRAIGVVYDPSADRWRNWVPTVMGVRYDAFCAFEGTDAVHPLHPEAPQPDAEHETEPFGT